MEKQKLQYNLDVATEQNERLYNEQQPNWNIKEQINISMDKKIYKKLKTNFSENDVKEVNSFWYLVS